MPSKVIEADFPISFRKDDAEKLGALLKNRRSAVLIGIKRVGISGFVRFFIYNKDIVKTYVKEDNHFFVYVDLSDLVEREIFPFWILTFKRLADSVEESDLDKKIKKQISTYFLDSIQTQDLFLRFDYLRKSLKLLSDAGIKTTIFFLRFDRLKDAATPELFDNLQGLLDHSNRRLMYVFTSFRNFDELFPSIFKKHELSYFADSVYIKPAKKEDSKIILDFNKRQKDVQISKEMEENLMDLVDGYSQYIQFSIISIHESKNQIQNAQELKEMLINDERINFQSEEIWESLTDLEKNILIKALDNVKLNKEDRENGAYLIKTGFINEETQQIFSPIFANFVKHKRAEMKKDTVMTELSKKEYLLLSFLESKANEICEREAIIEAVWPEAAAIGVSDWAIDRLVARLRSKLKNQNKKYEIVTIKTRGYKLIK